MDTKDWDILEAYSTNTTKAEIDPDKIYQDRLYEFHVLAVTPLAYSAPSESIFIDTRGEK